MKHLKRDESFCGRVPLNQTNQIQAYGALLILDPADLQIIQASSNIDQLVGKAAEDVVETTLDKYLPEANISTIQNWLQKDPNVKLPLAVNAQGKKYMSVLYNKDGQVMMEIVLDSRQGMSENVFVDVLQELKSCMAYVDAAASTQQACEIVARELKRLSGFDKIMIYKFDEEWNGDVIAEEKEEEMDAYLGLKFPASDIPPQARALYLDTPYRLIPDVNYTPVKVYPVINPSTGAFTNLTGCNLRSVAEVHLEYLRNMKVMSSMSTRILVNGKLWGLISCHHREAKFPGFEITTLFELIANLLSSKISGVHYRELLDVQHAQQTRFAKLVEAVYSKQPLDITLQQQQEELLGLLHAEGVSVVLDGKVHNLGQTPSIPEVEELMLWLQTFATGKVYHQTALSEAFEQAASYSDVASGILSIPVQPEKGSFIIAYRPEARRNVNWGGNPDDAVQFEKDGKAYHPRNSFQLWQQSVENTALPWSVPDLDIAEQFRAFLVDYSINLN